MTTHVDDTQQHDRDVELMIGGMTCASCAARIEKKLNRMPGVTATVNLSLIHILTLPTSDLV